MVELQRRKAELRKAGQRLFDFGTGDPVEPTAPFIRQALLDAVPEISQYPTVAGTVPFRQAVAAYCQRRFAVAIDPDTQVLPSAGSKEAIFHLPLAVIDGNTERNRVIFGTPGYPVYESGTLFANGRPEPQVLERSSGFRLDLTSLPSQTLAETAIAWINYPHNPTGAGVDLSYLQEQTACCQEHGILLASDECYADLWFDDTPPPSLLQLNAPNTMVFASCSKRSGMTGYRSGFISGDPSLIGSYRRWRASMGVGSPAFIEAAATAAWSDDAHAAERRAIFKTKYALLCKGLRQRGISVLESQAGLYVWAEVPGGLNADAYAERCLEAGIVISPGGFFGDGGAGWFRCALVPPLDDIEAALTAWPAV
jgi:succinyldiaminopimelate transaminase